MLLTQDGLRALADFTVHAAPEYDDDWNRVAGNDGVVLTCVHPQPHTKSWQKHWPGHVAAPTLRDLIMVAEQHWNREHQAAQAETVDSGEPA